MDFIVKTICLPNPGETVQAEDYLVLPGGKGANQAVAVSRMGGNVELIGCIGEDEYGESIKKDLKKNGVNLKHLRTTNNKKTGISLIGVEQSGNNIIITYPGANDSLSCKDIDDAKSIIENSKLVVLHWDVKQKVGEYFIKLSKKLGKKVVLNLAPIRPINEEVFKLIDYLIINEIEASKLSNVDVKNIESGMAAGKEIQNSGIEVVIITLGDKGAILFDKDEPKYYPALNVEVIDAIGAGDTFIGTFSKFCLEMTNQRAVSLACKAASLSVTRRGAMSSIPTNEELRDV